MPSSPRCWSLVAALLAALPAALAATPTVDEGLALVEAGRLEEAEPILAASLLGPSPDRLRAVSGLVRLAMAQPDPWQVRRRFGAGHIGGLEVPAEGRRVLELELDLALASSRAPAQLKRLVPAPGSAALPRLLTLLERHLEADETRAALEHLVDSRGGAGRAEPELVMALGARLEAAGQGPEAATLYRAHLQARDLRVELDLERPLDGVPGLEPLARALRRTHDTPEAAAALAQELLPDQNRGWALALRGWMRQAWSLHVVGDPHGATAALRHAEDVIPSVAPRPQLELAGLCLLLGAPARAARLYAAALAGGEAGVPRPRLLVLLASARALSGHWDAAIRSFWEASELGAALEALPALVHRLPPEQRPHQLLTALARVPARRGLGLLVAESLAALGRPALAVAPARASLREAPGPVAAQALAWLLSRDHEAAALHDLATRDDWRRDPGAYLGQLLALAPRPALAPELERLLARLDQPLARDRVPPLVRLVTRWHRLLSEACVARLVAGLPPAAGAVLAMARHEEEPAAAPAPLLAAPPSPEVATLWIELLAERGWRRLAETSLPALLALPLRPGAAQPLYLAAARWAGLAGDRVHALFHGLHALELAPAGDEAVALLENLLEATPEDRRILQAWAAHAENDHRLALAQARLWAAAGRPWRALGALRRARRATPNDPRVARALGELLREGPRPEAAAPHLMAAAQEQRLAGGGAAPPVVLAAAAPGGDDESLPGD